MEIYDNILSDLKSLTTNAVYSINNVKPVQWKDDSYVSEGAIEIIGYHKYIDTLIDDFEDTVEKQQTEQEKRKLKDLTEILDKIIEKCDSDNEFAKRTVNIPDVNDINEIFRLYETTSEKISSFLSKKYEKEDDVITSYEGIDSNLEDIKISINMTFSFKVDVNLHFMIKEFYDLIKQCEKCFFVSNSSKSGNYFYVLGESMDDIKFIEKYLTNYFTKDKDNLSYEDKEEAKIKKKILSCFNSIAATYKSVSTLLFNKTYSMLVSYIDKFN